MITHRISIPVALPAALLLAALLFGLSNSAYSTSSPQVYNVVDYGADPIGGNDSSGAVDKAIFAAISGGKPLGIIYFPTGTFKISGAIPAYPLTGTTVDMYGLTFMGSGVNATVISVASGGSITLTSSITSPYHGGSLKDFTLSCASNTLTGITTQDAAGIKWSNIAIKNCGTGVDMQNVSAWTERNDFDDVTFDQCGVAIHLDRKSTASNTSSFGYNNFRIWVNTYATHSYPEAIFLLSGGGIAYSSTYSVQGNIAYGTTLFDVHSYNTGGTNFAQSMYNDTFFVKVEDNAVGSGTSYVFNALNGGGGTGEVHGVGQFTWGGQTQWSAPGSGSALAITNTLVTPTDLGAVTIGGGGSDTISNPFITPNSRCFVQPNNSSGASLMTQVWISSTNWSQAVLTHPALHSGASYELWCHP